MMALLFIVLNSCQKDDSATIEVEDISAFKDEYGQFRKEIVVYDETKQNSLFFLIHANYSGDIENYLETHKLTLICETDENINNWENKATRNITTKSAKQQLPIPQEIIDHKVNIELITENIHSNINTFYLDVEKLDNNLKSGDSFQFGEFAAYKTTGDFIGVVHKGYWDDNSGDEYDIYVYLEKTNSWLAGWDILWQDLRDGEAGSNHYACCLNYTTTGNPYYKIGAGVYLDNRTNAANYIVAYNKDDYRGRTCTIGSYDKANCHVGTAPTGTTAFMYPDAQGAFYYTPINGNQCPYPGSSFDGAHCYVIDIPSTCEGFIYNNKWFVKTDKLL